MLIFVVVQAENYETYMQVLTCDRVTFTLNWCFKIDVYAPGREKSDLLVTDLTRRAAIIPP